MKIRAIVFSLAILFQENVFSQNEYYSAYDKLSRIFISDSIANFKNAVFIVEKAFNPSISSELFQNELALLLDIVSVHQKSDSLIYKGKDYEKVKSYSSVFRTMTDTTKLLLSGEKFEHKPFHYDFDDIFGEKSWENMFVTKLLATRKGNCHSMPYLYKILCEELNIPCFLALAPNHIYIKHRSEKAGMYNTELTSASFPIDAWLMASGYITLEAIQI